LGHNRLDDCVAACSWLATNLNNDGSLGITLSQSDPHWPTGWAVLAWRGADAAATAKEQKSLFTANIERAVAWILSVEGHSLPQAEYTGHDTSLRGWPWVEGTHSWIEPTAIDLLALRATDHGDHPRAREAVRLIVDRLLSHGGCNYGNTTVLGQELVPHLEPTGLAMIALAGEVDPLGRIERSLAYLADTISPRTTAASLSYALLGLAAHKRMPAGIEPRLAAAAAQTLRRGASPPRLALLALAALGEACPLIVGPASRPADLPNGGRASRPTDPGVLARATHPPTISTSTSHSVGRDARPPVV
jgi:hypothetical protein